MKQYYKNILISIFGGFQYGYNTAIIAGALLFLAADFSLSPLQQGILVSTTLFGGLAASFFAASIANRWGRKAGMALGALFFLAGALLSTFAWDYATLLMGRLITGFGVGMMSILVPLYLMEIAPVEKRGFIVSSNQIAMAIGSLLAYFSNYLFADSQNWRLMFGLGIIAAIVQFIALQFIDETLSKSLSEKTPSWKDIFVPANRSRLRAGLTLAIFQQITGISIPIYFAPKIFQALGQSSPAGATLATFAISTFNLLFIALSFWLVDKVGRRPLLLWGMSGMVISLLTLAFAMSTDSPLAIVLAGSGLLALTASYAIGIGPITPLFIAEIFPPSIRGQTMAFTGFIGWIFNYLVALTFLPLSALITSEGIFSVYALFGLLAIVLIAKKFPETKGKTLLEIEQEFAKREGNYSVKNSPPRGV